jgi:2-polyprenyl-3-methyl-5-hydroxy-6-metoxy-1,4-benzoquinol methylase
MDARKESHDWQQPDYAESWVAKNEQRTERRNALLASMLAEAPYAADAPLRVLDVGGGYGFVSQAVLKAFPKANVTLQDFSQPMIEQAQVYLAPHAAQMSYALSDLRNASWGKTLGPFDLVVSAIAIHNLRDLGAMATCYAVIHSLLVPGGWFLDCDHLDKSGGNALHAEMMRTAGFKSVVELPGDDAHTPILKAQA